MTWLPWIALERRIRELLAERMESGASDDLDRRLVATIVERDANRASGMVQLDVELAPQASGAHGISGFIVRTRSSRRCHASHPNARTPAHMIERAQLGSVVSPSVGVGAPIAS